MKYHHLVLLCSAIITIFCTKSAYSQAKVTILTEHDKDTDTIHFSVAKNLQLKCNSSESGDITWEKDGKALEKVDSLKGRVEFGKKDNTSSTITLKNLKEGDIGNYTCRLSVDGKKIASDNIKLATAKSALWGVRVSKNTNVVEGEKLTIKCEVRGELTLEWFYFNTTSGENYTKVTSEGRIKLEDYNVEDGKETKVIADGVLIIEEVEMKDRGHYICIGESEDGLRFNMTSSVRIKDKYAALWPFLGICAEVFVLCAIIFIYEKKRNKTELEESDTDQSPDQKNTPDHGKESNLRHRQ